MNGDIIQKIVSGYCPKYNTKNSIDVEYEEVRMVGDPKTYYKKGKYYCAKSDSQECNLNPCPIHSKAPNGF